MSWYDLKQAAADPDNPAANEQFPFSEHNALVDFLKDRVSGDWKLIDKKVDETAIGNDKILVYKTATSTFVFESQSTVGAIGDLSDVTISGVPADNEVVAYDTGTSKWINQTAAEAGLATVAGLASYLALAGGTMAGTLNMGDHLIDDVDDIQAFDASGIRIRDSAGNSKIMLGESTWAFYAHAAAYMNGYVISGILDPVLAQDAATKNYDDTHLFTKEAVTSFIDGYVPVYRTASGKFEMEDGGGAAGLPVTDTTSIVKGSADGTKLMRFEVDGLTTGTTRVLTVQDKDYTIADRAEVLLNPATATQDMNGEDLDDIGALILNDATELTIATGVVTITQSYHTIDTEGDAASDDLTTINGGTAGQTIVIRTHFGRDVVAKHNAGNMLLTADMTLNTIYDTLTLFYDGTYWLEISRADNGIPE